MLYRKISNNIPRIGENLAKYRGVEVIDRIGEDIPSNNLRLNVK